MARELNTADLGRPIRVMLFGGAYFEPEAMRFVVRLAEHEGIDFVGGFCQGRGAGVRHRVADLIRRRGVVAAAMLLAEVLRGAISIARHPVGTLRFRRRSRAACRKIFLVADIHAREVLQRVSDARPDLGLIYGAPILRPELFEIPRFGTIGIHHGRLPEYRGKKTTFWAMYNDERSAGVTIQRINAGLDTGEVLAEREVVIGGKRYKRVQAELEALGTELYLATILAIKEGRAKARPQRSGTSVLYRQPRPADIVRFWMRRGLARRPHAREA